jgi:Tol biopolymer transport system component
LSLDELPRDPIAVTYWEPENARRRAELLEEQRVVAQKRGVAEVAAIGRLLGGSSDRGTLARFPGRLCLVDPQTGRVTPVSSVPRGALPLAWSNDHQRLLFLSNHRGGLQIHEYSLETDEVRAITSGPSPHMSADYGLGEQITFLEVASENKRQFERIYVTDERGRSPRLVLEDRSAQTMQLSPDGTTLLYVRRVPGPSARSEPASELIAMDLVSGAEQPMGRGRQPSFSPMGDWIVYSAPSRDGWRLRRMRLDGSARSPITSGIRDEKMPSVSPDGRFIVYVGESTGLERLFVRRIDGSGDRILLDVGAVFSPVW